MSLLDDLNSDLKTALKGGDKRKTEVIRGLKSDLKYKEIEIGKSLSDDDMIAVLSYAAKKRRDSIEQFKAGNRDDLVEKETAELEIISFYLPKQMDDSELELLVQAAIEEADASSPSDMGKVMKIVIPQVKGRADGNKVKQIVQAGLSG